MQKKHVTYLVLIVASGLVLVGVAIEPQASLDVRLGPRSAPAGHRVAAATDPAPDSVLPPGSPTQSAIPKDPSKQLPVANDLSPEPRSASGGPSSVGGSRTGSGVAAAPHPTNPPPTWSSQPTPPPPPTSQIPTPAPAPGWSTAPAPFILGPVNLYRGVPSNWAPPQKSSGPLVWSQCLSDAAAQAGLLWRKTGTPGPLTGCATGGSTTGCGAFAGMDQKAASNSYFCYANSATYGNHYFGAAWIVDPPTSYAYLYEIGV